MRPYEEKAQQLSLFPSNFDVMDVNAEVAKVIKSRAALRRPFMCERKLK